MNVVPLLKLKKKYDHFCEYLLLGGIQKVHSHFQFLTLLCLFMFILHVSPFHCTFALVNYPPPPLTKKVCDAYEFSNEKSGSKKREKN